MGTFFPRGRQFAGSGLPVELAEPHTVHWFTTSVTYLASGIEVALFDDA